MYTFTDTGLRTGIALMYSVVAAWPKFSVRKAVGVFEEAAEDGFGDRL